jgi:hypothetical protein
MRTTMLVFENRAATILFIFLKNLQNKRIFLLPSNVCPIVPLVFLKAGQKFEFVDICEKSFCLDEDSTLEILRSKPDYYAGILFVRMYGVMHSVHSFFDRVKEINNNFIIIDDRCLVIPEFKTEDDHRADVILYSTGYSKYVDIGFGGFGIINNSGREFKRYSLPYHPEALQKLILGYHDAIQRNSVFEYRDAEWLDCGEPNIAFSDYRQQVVSKISETTSHKTLLNDIYTKNLPQEIQFKPEFQHWRFNITVPDKKALLATIFKNGLFASSVYSSADRLFCGGVSKNTERVYSQVINLFNDRYFSEEKALTLTTIINRHLKNYRIGKGNDLFHGNCTTFNC